MHRPPRTPAGRPVSDQPARRSVAAGYLAIAALPVLLWAVANPLTALLVATALATAIGALHVATPRTRRLAECLRECCCATIDVGGRVHVAISYPNGA